MLFGQKKSNLTKKKKMEENNEKNIDISFTYKNPNTNKYEYDKPYIIEKGEYYLIVNSCSYDTEKYYISDTNKAEELTIRIE